jgi:ATP-dependent Clp protease adaptor protein ClpS
MSAAAASTAAKHFRGSTPTPEVTKIQRLAMPTDPKSSQGAPEQDGELQILERKKTQRPRRYQVIFHNDDYTTMEFVVHVLMKFFGKSETESTHIMLNVHHKGYGVVDVFPRDIAETKASLVMEYAREHGQPLKCTAEPDGFDE